MGRYWAYFDGEKRVMDRATIDRLNSVALPPAYKDAWFCKDPDGHLQATGSMTAAASNIAITPTSAPRPKPANSPG